MVMDNEYQQNHLASLTKSIDIIEMSCILRQGTSLGYEGDFILYSHRTDHLT